MIKEAIETGLAVFDRLYAEVRAIRKRKLSEDNFLRAYYLEVKGNLELLSLLKDDAFKGANPMLPAGAGPGFASFTGRLQTQLAAALFFAEKGGGLRQRNAVRRLRRECPGILKPIAFTLVKIELLKRLAEFTPEERALFHGVNLTSRLDHIEERLKEIVTSLSTSPFFKKFMSASEAQGAM